MQSVRIIQCFICKWYAQIVCGVARVRSAAASCTTATAAAGFTVLALQRIQRTRPIIGERGEGGTVTGVLAAPYEKRDLFTTVIQF